MQIVLIRHAESTANAAGILAGRVPEVAAGGQNVATQADVKVTAAKNNLTEEEAKKRLRAAGYLIEGEE